MHRYYSPINCTSCIVEVLQVPQILHFEPSLDALSLRVDIISRIKILSSLHRGRSIPGWTRSLSTTFRKDTRKVTHRQKLTSTRSLSITCSEATNTLGSHEYFRKPRILEKATNTSGSNEYFRKPRILQEATITLRSHEYVRRPQILSSSPRVRLGSTSNTFRRRWAVRL